MLTIKSLKAAIADLPDDMPVALNESVSEVTGLASSVSVVKGAEADDRPYDKGDDVYQMAAFRARKDPAYPIKQDTHVCFIHS